MKIFLACPGPSFDFGALRGILMASNDHEVYRQNSAAAAGNFDILWCDALNESEAGLCTHFAMIHSDISPEPGWLDVLVEEMEKHAVGLLSAAVPIKDHRGLCSCGVARSDTNWSPRRRVTVRELLELPETFGAADFGYPGECLIHNNGLWLADLRHPEWRATDADGHLIASHKFPRASFRDPATGLWQTMGESEDWYFSRQAHELGIPSKITRRVKLTHRGATQFSNFSAWGTYEHDEDTRAAWDVPARNGRAPQPELSRAA